MYPRETSCAFTGHRPEKLPWGSREDDPRCAALQEHIRSAVEQAVISGYRHFLCGMARGCDTWFAQAVLALKETYPDITLEAAIPCADQAHRWRAADRQRYEDLLAQCDTCTVLSPAYAPGCMQRRNRYLVDHCALLIAVHDGLSGGTQNTIAYAFSRRVDVAVLPVAMGGEV